VGVGGWISSRFLSLRLLSLNYGIYVWCVRERERERERERGVYIKGTLISMFLSLRLLKPKALKGVRERQRLQTSRMNERGGKA
jgi:hypothetical protein